MQANKEEMKLKHWWSVSGRGIYFILPIAISQSYPPQIVRRTSSHCKVDTDLIGGRRLEVIYQQSVVTKKYKISVKTHV